MPSLLSIAARRKDTDLIRILIRGGAEGRDSNTLCEAVKAEASMVTIQLLLSAAGSWRNKQYGVGAMREAICQKNHALVRHLVGYIDIHGASSNNHKRFESLSPLGEAIQFQDCESAKILIGSGVDIEAPVTWVGMEGSPLKRQAPMLAAIGMNHLPMVEFLRFEIVEFLLSKGVGIDSAPFYSGGTPLQLAAMNGFLGIAKLLIEHGANVNHPFAEGDTRTVFEAAAEWGKIDTITLLVQNGADLDLVSRPEPSHGTYSAGFDYGKTTHSCGGVVVDNEVYGTQYQRAVVFAERRGQWAIKRFVQHIHSENRDNLALLSSVTDFDGLMWFSTD